MSEFGLDLLSCVGIGTDGCSVMISETEGAVNAIKEKAVIAERCHCFNHELNLSLKKSSKLPQVRDPLNVMQEVISFFTQSAKRSSVLLRVSGKQLKSVCKTRWVETYHAISDFADRYSEISESLEDVETWKDRKTSTQASLLSTVLRNFEFLITINILKNLFAVTVPLSATLQSRQLNVQRAEKLVQDTIEVLKRKRGTANSSFK